MRDFSFGQYYPVASPVHKLDARAKMIFTILFVVFIFFVESYISYGVVLAFLLLVTATAHIPFSSLFKSIRLILFLVVFTFILNLFLYKEGSVLCSWWIFTITDKGLDFACKMALRLTTLVMGASLLTYTTAPMELTDAIESLLKPLKYIKFPVHEVALVMSMALRFIPNLMEETDKIIMAQKARGSGFDTGNFIAKVKAMLPVLIPLFVSAFRRADELADALDARCYNATNKRTKLKKLHFGWRDAVALLVFAAFLTFILLDKYLWGGLDSYFISFVSTL